MAPINTITLERLTKVVSDCVLEVIKDDYYLLYLHIILFPTDFRITKTTPSTDSILVEWSYPTTNEGDVLAFVMTASYQGPCSDEVPRRTDFNYYKESRNWTVRQLQPFGHYMVTVKALPEYHGSSDNTTLPSNTSTLPAGRY